MPIEFAPTLPVLSLFLIIALIQRQIAHPKIQGILAASNWLLLMIFIGSYAMKLGRTVQA